MDRIVELTGLDHACLRKAQGKRLLQEESIQVSIGVTLKLICFKNNFFKVFA